MEDKKARIIQAAIEVLSSKGIEKTKVSDIVKRAGIAQGTFYLYFPSKLAVMPSIAEVMVQKTLSYLEKNVDPEAAIQEQLQVLIRTVFQLQNEEREKTALLFAGLASSEYLKEWESIYAPYYKWMSTLLGKAQARGTIRSSLDVNRTARLLIGIIESAAEQIYLYDQIDEMEAKVQTDELYTFIKHALGIEVL
ncbi:TetR family transcriptional regulator [Paenibacillus kribbensis]|uniref:TetR family transcriptional regulator n=1 Tax=Paenibacillus kribbensis TaxID=172713 RepID=A0A222WP15_9BACL|nr:TetR family transcriptional regulator [Paenibacillus kribbensis]ASR47481.1 TetR family transcriptional regulator [Paenibacillus kribbensis]